jgi:hypothetical protein
MTTELHRQNLLTFCAFATVAIQAADREARGGDPAPREEAIYQLRIIMRALDTYKPLIDQLSTQPYTEAV